MYEYTFSKRWHKMCTHSTNKTYNTHLYQTSTCLFPNLSWCTNLRQSRKEVYIAIRAKEDSSVNSRGCHCMPILRLELERFRLELVALIIGESLVCSRDWYRGVVVFLDMSCGYQHELYWKRKLTYIKSFPSREVNVLRPCSDRLCHNSW